MSTTITHRPAHLPAPATTAERLVLRATVLAQDWVGRRIERRSHRPDLAAATERRRRIQAAGRIGDPRL
ncbi:MULTISPECIES: hypothetical protein [unclassified Pseudactinotalea]|uniref:hypothetical protein n=1 Tax=unclassified Pseudactinotalea TaxID=2649176 RepID=UPI00128E10A9|nr:MULTISPECIES: hypothetical protein [unclassified Pseudactinotalea]MPV49724.1 hypothetical protein [Pseudactinotalea sp. HY160]QGH69603.1 hypothetical protein GCE65_08800 [Pseudactinotalea sp. HY158]